jgi:TolA-binding protein
LELGLAGKERRGALLGLGSTLRTLGEYEEAQAVFEEAMKAFPEAREFNVFYAMVLYNLRKHEEAMAVLLGQLADTSADEGIRIYSRAIRFYAGRLDRIWD